MNLSKTRTDKFKIGDTVKWLGTGEIGEIIGICKSFKDSWNVKGIGNSCAEEGLELVEMNPLDFKIRGHLNGIKYPCLVDIKYDGITVVVDASKPKEPVIFKTDSQEYRHTKIHAEEHSSCFLGEWIHGEGKLGSLKELQSAKAESVRIGLETDFVAFEVIEYKGKTYERMPLIDRRSELLEIFQYRAKRVPLGTIANNKKEVEEFAELAIKAGYEGVVVKNLHETFAQQTWVKIKLEDELILPVTKVEDTRFEVTYEGVIVGVKLTRPVAIGDMVQILHNGVTDFGSLRNPRQVKS